jgi:5'(3')-deoxyribonucleotidase
MLCPCLGKDETMSKPIILCDVDGVLADFRQLYVDCANELFRNRSHSFHREDIDQWDCRKALGLTDEEDDRVWEMMRSPGRVLNMQRLPGATEALRALGELGNVYFVTSPDWHGSWMVDRVKWLQMNFAFLTGGDERKLASRVIFAKAETKRLIRGDLFIDDKKETVEQWKKNQASPYGPTGLGVLFDNFAEQGGLGWADIIHIAETLRPW